MTIQAYASEGAFVPPTTRMGLSPGVLAAVSRVQHALRDVLLGEPHSALPDVAQGLADQGLLVTLRSGLGVGIDSPDYLSTLRHSFLICQEGSSGLCIIVDLSFQDQFSVAGMPASSSYTAAVGNVPKCFVGTIGTVNALVCLLTGTLYQEASALGMELPPWRSKQALLSKWLPRRFADTVFTPPSFASLHPALKCSVHDALSSSPVSIQSWPSLGRNDSSQLASSGGSPADGCRNSARPCVSGGSKLPADTHPVILGFAAVPPASVTCVPSQTSPIVPVAAAAWIDSATPATANPAVVKRAGGPCQRGCSALTQQLAAATAASRMVQLEAEAHWQRCLLGLAAQPAVTSSSSPSSASAVAASSSLTLRPSEPQPQAQLQAQAQTPTGMKPGCAGDVAVRRPTEVCSRATDELCGKSDVGRSLSASLRSGQQLSRSVLNSLVVSPGLRRSSGSSGAARRGTSYGLKLGSETLKMLPRIYTVKLAAAVVC